MPLFFISGCRYSRCAESKVRIRSSCGFDPSEFDVLSAQEMSTQINIHNGVSEELQQLLQGSSLLQLFMEPASSFRHHNFRNKDGLSLHDLMTAMNANGSAICNIKRRTMFMEFLLPELTSEEYCSPPILWHSMLYVSDKEPDGSMMTQGAKHYRRCTVANELCLVSDECSHKVH